MSLTCIELFAGAGGLSLGLNRAGFDVVLANEIEPDFAKTYALNHPNTEVLNIDIHQVDFVGEATRLGLKKLDLLSGGPPCQGFSTVGSKNAADPRNSLFYEFLRAASELGPDYILFENVSGFKKMYGGAAYSTLLEELHSFGYKTTSAVLEGSDFGLPQNRQRTIVLGWKSTLPKVCLPMPTHSDESSLYGNQPKMVLMDAISDLPPLVAGESASLYASSPKNE